MARRRWEGQLVESGVVAGLERTGGSSVGVLIQCRRASRAAIDGTLASPLAKDQADHTGTAINREWQSLLAACGSRARSSSSSIDMLPQEPKRIGSLVRLHGNVRRRTVSMVDINLDSISIVFIRN